MPLRQQQLLSLAVSILVPLTGGFLIGSATRNEINGWYRTLRRPSWTPPNWLFGPMWTFLYISMGYASYLVYNSPIMRGLTWLERLQTRPLLFYGTQLCANFLWSPLFFIFHRPDLALIDIIATFGLLVKTGLEFHKINPTAGLLFIPYAIWVGYASTVNAGVWWLNRKTLGGGAPNVDDKVE